MYNRPFHMVQRHRVWRPRCAAAQANRTLASRCRAIDVKGTQFDVERSQPKQYGPKFKPKYTVPDTPNGSQPSVWWDPKDGWWSHEPQPGEPRRHYDRWGNRVNMNDKPTIMDKLMKIPPQQVAKWGTGAVLIYLIVSEGSRLYPPRNLVPVP